MKSGDLYKLGMGTLYRPWTKRHFTLSINHDRTSHATPVLTYYTCDTRRFIKEVPLTAGMSLRLIQHKGNGWDASRPGDPPGVGILLTYGYTYAGRKDMLLVANTQSDAQEWLNQLTVAIQHNDRRVLKNEKRARATDHDDGIGNSSTAEELRNSIASNMGLLSTHPPAVVSSSKSCGDGHVSYLLSFIISMCVYVTNVLGVKEYLHEWHLVAVLAPMLPFLVPRYARDILWMVLCYIYVIVIYYNYLSLARKTK